VRRRGFTLIEMMIVVAIAGVLAAMSAVTYSAVQVQGRLNGTADVLVNVLRTARFRAITERCTYVVQMTGYTFSSTSADVRRPASLILFRKNNCNSTVGAFTQSESNVALRDRQVNDFAIEEFLTELRVPAGVVTGDALLNNSVSISWSGDGTRRIYSDDDGDGASTDTSIASGDFPITIVTRGGAGTPNRIVTVPAAGPPVAP